MTKPHGEDFLKSTKAKGRKHSRASIVGRGRTATRHFGTRGEDPAQLAAIREETGEPVGEDPDVHTFDEKAASRRRLIEEYKRRHDPSGT